MAYYFCRFKSQDVVRIITSSDDRAMVVFNDMAKRKLSEVVEVFKRFNGENKLISQDR